MVRSEVRVHSGKKRLAHYLGRMGRVEAILHIKVDPEFHEGIHSYTCTTSNCYWLIGYICGYIYTSGVSLNWLYCGAWWASCLEQTRKRAFMCLFICFMSYFNAIDQWAVTIYSEEYISQHLWNKSIGVNTFDPS